MITNRIGLALCVLGLAVSGYLTFEHYTASATLVCAGGGGIINCESVTTSEWSLLFGIPVALLGLLYYVAMTALFVPAVADRLPRVGDLRLGGATLGLVFVLYLVWAEFFGVGQICSWCTVVHLTTMGLLLISAWQRLTS
jgi:uncharacterized membrane protein